MTTWQRLWVRFMMWDDLRRGQGTLEYGLLIILVGILMIVLLIFLSDELAGLYEMVIARWMKWPPAFKLPQRYHSCIILEAPPIGGAFFFALETESA